MKNPPSRHGRRTSRRARWAPISTPSLIKNLRVDRVRAQGHWGSRRWPGGFNQGGETSESTKAEKPCGTRGHDLLRPKSLSPPSLRPVLAPSSSPRRQTLVPPSPRSAPLPTRVTPQEFHPGARPACRGARLRNAVLLQTSGAERRVAESSGLGAGSGERG